MLGDGGQAPSNGTLQQVLEADCDAAATALPHTSNNLRAGQNCSENGRIDILAGLPFCAANTFSSLDISLAPDGGLGVGGQTIKVIFVHFRFEL